ncbi:MAG: pyridoxal phosphate-dependent aminotransferase [bacterium]
MTRLGGEAAFELLIVIKALQEQQKKIVCLNIGEPDFDTPAHIIETGVEAMRHHETHYTASPGRKETREAVARFMTRTRGVPVDWQQVTIFPGAKPAVFLTMLALLNEGDEVIFPDPGYPTYWSVAGFVGAIGVPLVLSESLGFRFQLDQLRSLITPKTRMLILNSPQNPTGGVLTKSDLEGIAGLCREHDLYVFSDEIYSQIFYDTAFASIYSESGMAERTIVLDGWSKAYAMTGWRLGFTVSNREIASALGLLMTNSNSCAASFTQLAGIAALEGDQQPVAAMVKEFRTRRDLLVDGLNDIPGIHCHRPEGAFYVVPNVSSFGYSAKQIQDYLLSGASIAGIVSPEGVDGVASLAGTAFGAAGEGYLRLSYANSQENLLLALSFLRTAFGRIHEVLGSPRTAAGVTA